MTLEQLPLIMLRALLLTLIIECAIAWILGVRSRDGQKVVFLANLMTNPLVVSIGAGVLLFLGRNMLFPITVIMEVIVVVVEGVVYRRYLDIDRNPFFVSLACNTGSFLIGELLNRFVF